jgi:hypothetical protein
MIVMATSDDSWWNSMKLLLAPGIFTPRRRYPVYATKAMAQRTRKTRLACRSCHILSAQLNFPADMSTGEGVNFGRSP